MFHLRSLLCCFIVISILFRDSSGNTFIYNFVRTPAAVGEFPFQAFLQNVTGHFCGGAILTSSWIITAAHCITNGKPPALSVRVGSVDRSKGDKYDIDLVMINENFTWTETNPDSSDDLALLRTQEPIQFSEFVQPISIDLSFIRGGMSAVFGGWGRTADFVDSSSRLLLVLDYTTMSHDECREQMPEESRANVYSRSLCVSNVLGRGMCLGDSGGPLVIDGKLVGVASWGIECGMGYPDVFTRVYPYRKWITFTTNRYVRFNIPPHSKCVCKNTNLGDCICSKPRTK